MGHRFPGVPIQAEAWVRSSGGRQGEGMILKERKCDPVSLLPWSTGLAPSPGKLCSTKATDTC